MGDFIRYDVREVDLNKPLLRTNTGVLLAAGDKSANRFGAILHRDGEPVDLAGQAVTVMGYFVRPDGNTVVCKGGQDGSMVYVDLPAVCYAQSGAFALAIKVSGTDITQTVRVIDGVLRLTSTDAIVDPGEIVPTLEELLALIADMDAASPIISEKAGTVVSITDAAVRDAKSVITHINVVQEGAGTPGSDNIRPIVPVESVTLRRGAEYDTASASVMTANMPNDVYGGTYDWVSGKVTKTYGVITLKGSGRTWQTGEGNFYTAISDRATNATLYCDRYAQVGSTSGMQPGQMALGAKNGNVCFGTSLTLAEWQAALDAEPLVLVYELAEPTLAQLEPQRVTMLNGSNALWSDTGDTEVAYVVDTKTYVDAHAGTGSGGQAGISPVAKVTQTSEGATITITDASGTTTATVQHGKDGSAGEDGSNGVSCTHSWSGTTLSVTSASGTSSANLKGDKGDTGAEGKTPVKGTDYFTTADKTDMVNQVKVALPTLTLTGVDADGVTHTYTIYGS